VKNVVVQKFGGSSLKDIDALNNCAQIILKAVKSGNKVVAVVSAMGSQTNHLLALANTLGKSRPSRELDMLLTSGERITSALMCLALHKISLSAISLTGSQCGIITDNVHGNAQILGIKPERLQQSINDFDVVVVAGFQGVCQESKDITSLGRGGSDLTAVALANFLQTDVCEIYTNVDGVMRCDPKKVNNAQLSSHISWKQMSSLSNQGAQVLHHKAANLALSTRQKIVIKNTFSPDKKGTKISKEKDNNIFIAHRENQILCSLSTENETRLISKVQKWLWSQDENPSFCCQYESTSTHLELVISQINYPKFYEKFSKIAQIKANHKNVATISIVGYVVNNIQTVSESLKNPPLLLNLSDTCIIVIPMGDLHYNLNNLHNSLL
jgi:aspartate kinase